MSPVKPPETVIILVNGQPQRVSKDWVWQNCDGQGGTKTVKDFPQVPEEALKP